MRVAYVCNEYPPLPHGGIGTFVRAIAQALQRLGHCVTVVGLGQEDSERREEGVRIVQLRRPLRSRWGSIAKRLTRVSSPRISARISPVRALVQALCDRLERRKLRRWLSREARSQRIDIVEVFDYGGCMPFPFRHCPVVVRLELSLTLIFRAATAAGVETGRPMSFGQRLSRMWRCRLEALTLRHHRQWIAVSRRLLEQTRAAFNIDPLSSVVISNPAPPPDPVDDSPPAGLPGRYLLSVGHVGERKGAFRLAAAFRLLLTRHPDLHLVFIGPLLHEENMNADDRIRLIAGPEAKRRILFLGRLGHGATLACIRRASVFIMPSALEGLSVALLEALASGRPAVCSPAAGGGVLQDEGNVLIADPADAEAMAAKISKLLDDPGYAAALGERASRDAQRYFSLAGCAERTIEFYRMALDRFRSGGREN